MRTGLFKILMLALALALLIPNFIERDINEQYPYNGKERYFPSLAHLNSIDKLEQYTDETARMKNIAIGSPEYAALLAYVISCRFYHGFSHWKLNENWIAAVSQKITGIGLACKVQPDEIMQHPFAACSQQALVMMAVLRKKNVSYRKVGFPHHYALEVNMNNQWYFFDPNMEPRISFAERSHSNWKGDNDIIKQYYSTAHHQNLDYQFGRGEKAIYGAVNEIPAQRANFFQGFTSIVSKFLWMVPLVFAFAFRRKPYMYAVKPVNKNFNPPPKLTPLYYA
jgi:hypothetical protein